MSAPTPSSQAGEPAPRLLAFDTSTERLSVAVLNGSQRVIANEAGGALASARLLPLIDALLQRAEVKLPALDAIAFGRGPGAFTGLRTSAAVAQGLAFGSGRPVLPLDSLMIVAEDARAQLGEPDRDLEMLVCMDARMDEVYAGLYLWRPLRPLRPLRAGATSGWQILQPPALCTLAALSAMTHRPTAVCGSALLAFGQRLQLPALAQRLPEELDRAAAMLRVAEQRWSDGAAVAAEEALPLYLRDKVALTTLERDAVRAAKVAAEARP